MFYRQLGNTDVKVSAIGLGCLAVGGPWRHCGEPVRLGEADDSESIRAIHRALDLGINFFDTAANYGAGHSESVLGQALGHRRPEVLIGTKFGYQVDEETQQVDYYDNDINSDKVVANIRQECEASLRRLNTDYIDLYQFHVNEYDVEKSIMVREVLEDLVSEGKIRFYGWSTENPQAARTFVEGKHCVAIQHTLNVVLDTPKMIAICHEFNQTSLVRNALGKGFLTGKYNAGSKFAENDLRSRDDFRNGLIRPILEVLEQLLVHLTSDGRTPAQGAVGWVWARSEQTIPIPGFGTAAQIEDNAKAMEFGPLGAEQMQAIEDLLKHENSTDEVFRPRA